MDYVARLSLITTSLKDRLNEYMKELSELETENESDDKNTLGLMKSILIGYIYVKAVYETGADYDENLARVTTSLLERLFPFYVELIENKLKRIDEDQTKQGTFVRKIVRFITPDVTLILNIVTYLSMKFCMKLLEINGLRILYKYLTNETLLDYYNECAAKYQTKNPEFENIDGVLRRVIGTLVCSGRTYSSYKNEWKNNASVKNFLTYLNRTKNIIDNKLYTSMAIAFVADDEDVDQLPQLREALPELTKIVAIAAKNIKEEQNLVRTLLELDDSEEKKEVYCVTHIDTAWSIINLIKALYHLSVSDKLKNDIYYKYNMSKYLRMIIYNGNDVEREYSILLLWQLCFDKQIAADVLNDGELYNFINSISQNPSLDKKLVENACGIIWVLNNNSSQDEIKPPVPLDDKSGKNLADLNLEEINQKHIMISYNRESRDLCLKVKAELEKLGYKIWIDVESIHGSSLEAMANAIENSVCVLMCMTEKYKQSANCRLEAEYSFQQSKPIIPLIMQKDYKPDGWLGIILGSKIFIPFMKYDFEECMKRLVGEIQSVYKDNKLKVEILQIFKPPEAQETKKDAIEPPPPDTKTKSEKPNNAHLNPNANGQQTLVPSRPSISVSNIREVHMTEADVNKWFAEKNICPNIVNHLKNTDGHILHELLMIKLETPEFFYKSIGFFNNPYKSTTLRDVAHFSYELKKLFII